MRRLLASLSGFAVVLLVAAPAALARTPNDGRGFWGELNDKVVTNVGFILIGFFPLFVFVASMIQWQLDKRKEARKAAAKRRLRDPQWRGGW